MKKTNYHTHSTFCDGKSSPAEIAAAAFEKKFDVLGFSSHSMFPFSSGWHLPVNEHKNYVDEIRRLKKIYDGRMKIYAGFEADFIPGVCLPDFSAYCEFSPDYLIGSVHFVTGKGGFVEADGNPAEVRRGIREFFGGNVKKTVCEYFSLEKEMIRKGNFSILGHADLFRRQNAGDSELFSENSAWYKKELKSLSAEISGAGIVVEVNTGGILRCGMKSPYPSPYFLSILREKNVPVTLNSDCHEISGLDFWFDEAVEYIKKAGYTELSFYEDGVFKMQKI